MSEKKFQFVSPGVFVEEIDKSFLEEESTLRGPLVVGRSEHGPTMAPTKVQSFSEFAETFGTPIPGGRGGDVWRDGNYTSPTYAAYAAQAYLRNNTPVTFVRLVGSKHVSGDATGGTPGYNLGLYTSGTSYDLAGGGAQGLFVFNSGSIGGGGGYGQDVYQSGTLAAVWYFHTSSARIELIGEEVGATSNVRSGAGILLEGVGSAGEVAFKARVVNNGVTASAPTTFNFTPSSDKFIRKVWNTNPTLADDDNNSATDAKVYWLGESFEGNLKNTDDEQGVLGTGSYHGVILPVQDWLSAKGGGDFKLDSQPAKSGWVFHQDFGLASSFDPSLVDLRLFRFVARASDNWAAKHIKVSIKDLKFSNNDYDKWGTFTIEIRDARDTDASKVVLERFEEVSLNPNSSNFIARKIGDQYESWDSTALRNRVYGFYENKSKHVYVEVTDAVRDGGINERALPVGFYGPPKFNSFFCVSGSNKTYSRPARTVNNENTASVFVSNGNRVQKGNNATFIRLRHEHAGYAGVKFSGSVEYPKINLRQTSDDSTLSDPRNSYFGLETRTQEGGRLFQESYLDLIRVNPSDVSSYDDGTYTETSVYFTLDDLSASLATVSTTNKILTAVYSSGSRKADTSLTAQGRSFGTPTVAYTANLQGLVKLGYDKFTMPLFGGFDGFDVRKRDPLANRLMTDAATETNSFVYNTYRRAIDMVQDVEGVDINLASVPGLTNTSLTTRLISNCEERADVLAIVDLDGGFKPRAEREISDLTEAGNLGSVTSVITNLKDRNLNSSYGCAYYPWVLIRDTATTGQTVWVPPSVVALGVMGNSATESELWFAPAGFNRGGLTEGDSGLTVVGVRERLSAKDRDDLYEQNINPIATFPAEGVVIFGQKTLQVTRSALDRINVRRLLIFLKKEISFAASRILFDQNVEATWTRFKGQVVPLLSSVQARFGLTDFKLILDRTTTTPELIDRNIMYAKIFLKPARAIEYIALDFIITATGASFEE